MSPATTAKILLGMSVQRITHRCCGTLDQRLESMPGQQVTLLLKDSCSVLYVHGSAFPGNLNACGTAGRVSACEFHSDRKKVGSTDLIVTAARSGIAEIEVWTVDSRNIGCKLCDLGSADTKQVGASTVSYRALSPTIWVAPAADVRLAYCMPACPPWIMSVTFAPFWSSLPAVERHGRTYVHRPWIHTDPALLLQMRPARYCS